MALINFAGIASGIDSSALIDALLDQTRQARITPSENQIVQIQDTNSALDQVKTLLGELNSAASKFRLLNGGAISRLASSSDETKVSAAASNSAAPGVYDVTVSSLAKNATFSFDDRFSSTTEVINGAINDGDPAIDRTVSFTIGTGASSETVDIELTSTTTAQDFVNSFNTASNSASASLVNTGTNSSPSYAIVINSNEEGLEEGTITLDAVGASLGPSFATNTLDQATDAEFTIDGIAGTISRSSNTFSDVITGVTFSLESTGSATITISNDTSTTQSNVQDFVDAYNELVTYIADNDSITQEEDGSEVTNIFGPLAETSLDESILSSIRSALSSASISGGAVNTLADLGITTNRDGTLDFDTDTFNQAVTEDAESVGTIFENLGEQLSATGGTIAQFTQFNGLLDQSINSNNTIISDLQDRIASTEASLARQSEQLTATFARLESEIGKLQGIQSTLSGILPS